MVVTEGLTKQYGSLVAVDNLNLKVKRGTIFGLLGPNGAGKTTTILMLLGLTEPTAGKVRIDGCDPAREPLKVKSRAGYLPDAVGFYQDMTGWENLRYTAELNGLPEDVAEDRIARAVERVGLVDAADRKVGEYSRGMRQRLGIADLLVKDPPLIIMDEPTLGIDPEGVRELLALIRTLAREDGRTILLSSHLLHQVQEICDEVGIFVRGKMIACGTVDDLGRQLLQGKRFSLEVEADPVDERLLNICRSQPGVLELKQDGPRLILLCSRDIRPQLTKEIVTAGYSLQHLTLRGYSLDEIYRRYFIKEEGEYGRTATDTKKTARH
ncbi:MAG TPA: ABC transporter ATP-binding protein [Firmicutes bacterium]|nr:ABC transporter ATP-binding protein [Bacillota bacterium]